jgi:hypothetical protein
MLKTGTFFIFNLICNEFIIKAIRQKLEDRPVGLLFPNKIEHRNV